MESEIIKIQLGAGNNIVKDCINCDSRQLCGIDNVFDLESSFPYPFPSNYADLIFTQETMEHLSWRIIPKVLNEIYRILKPNGIISIQVPDIGQMCVNYVNGEICECVPHKSDYFFSDPSCKICNGKGKINPIRWLMALSGAQKHPWDIHKTPFTKEYINKLLIDAKFKNIEFQENIYKIKVKAKK